MGKWVHSGNVVIALFIKGYFEQFLVRRWLWYGPCSAVNCCWARHRSHSALYQGTPVLTAHLHSGRFRDLWLLACKMGTNELVAGRYGDSEIDMVHEYCRGYNPLQFRITGNATIIWMTGDLSSEAWKLYEIIGSIVGISTCQFQRINYPRDRFCPVLLPVRLATAQCGDSMLLDGKRSGCTCTQERLSRMLELDCTMDGSCKS